MPGSASVTDPLKKTWKKLSAVRILNLKRPNLYERKFCVRSDLRQERELLGMRKLTEEDASGYIAEKVHALYYGEDMNCARTTLTCLSHLLDIGIAPQTMTAALGLHGAGGYRAQCGLVEGALMMIGIFGKEAGLSDREIVDLCYRYADIFTAHFGSLTCAGLRPGGFNEDDPPHLCENLTVKAICFALDYLLKIETE